jgi:spermidine/putrescine transport system substrate-binding protein
MNRIKFIDRMAQGKLTRRQMLTGAGAFGIGMTVLPRLAKADPLVCMEWAGYDTPDHFGSYVAKHGSPPNFSIFANEDEALQKIRAGFNADIMHPCTYSIVRFTEAKLTVPIDTTKLSNWPDVIPALQTTQGVVVDGNVVMVPADWGNSSIAYRTDLVGPEDAESWGIFYGDKYTGKVAFTDSEVAVEIAGLMLGYTPKKIWEMSDEEIAATKPLVQKLVKNCRFIWSDPTQLNQALASGEIVAGYAWNDTVKQLKKEGVPVKYAVPKEGIFTWLCGLTMLNVGKADAAAAYDFLDAWLSPETGKFLIENAGYGHSNRKAFEIANPEEVAALGITDPVKALANGIFFQPVEAEREAKYIKLWEESKAL